MPSSPRHRSFSLVRRIKSGPPGRCFKTKTEPSGAATHASGGLCCSALSLDEAANAAQGVRNATENGSSAYTAVHVPHGPTEISVGAVAGYLSLGGAYISSKIYRSAGAKIRELNAAMESSVLRDAAGSDDAAAAKRYLRGHIKEQRFQRRWAGLVSGVGSALTFGGILFKPLTAAGLFIMASAGAAHTVHELKAAFKASKAASRACRTPELLGATERERFFTMERSRRLINAAGWGIFTLGAGILGAGTVAALAAGVTIFPPALLIAGVTGLFGGAAATVVYNNMMTGPRFAGLPEHDVARVITGKDGKPLTQQECDRRLKQAASERGVIKDFRRSTLEAIPAKDKALFFAQRMRQKAFGLLSLGLLTGVNHSLKHRARSAAVKAIPATQEADAARIRALKSLAAVRNGDCASLAAARTAWPETRNPDVLLEALREAQLTGPALKGFASVALEYKSAKKDGVCTAIPRFTEAFAKAAKIAEADAARQAQALHEAAKSKGGSACCGHEELGRRHPHAHHPHAHEHHHEHPHEHHPHAHEHEAASALPAELLPLLRSPAAQTRLKHAVDMELTFTQRSDIKKRTATYARCGEAFARQAEKKQKLAAGR